VQKHTGRGPETWSLAAPKRERGLPLPPERGVAVAVDAAGRGISGMVRIPVLGARAQKGGAQTALFAALKLPRSCTRFPSVWMEVAASVSQKSSTALGRTATIRSGPSDVAAVQQSGHAACAHSIANFTHAGFGTSVFAPVGAIFPVSGSTLNVTI
jgi:hypothetical protein